MNRSTDRSIGSGQPAPDYNLSDKQNQPVNLLAFKGQVVLVDFWSSRCDYCRNEHSHLKALYDQYKDRGLQIVSISIDENPKAWRKALQKSGLPWPQLTDRVGSRNVAGPKFSKNPMPMNLLIDKDGYVIRKGLHGLELDRQLALVFNTL
ncbi:TlpA family protein disulfide reductase [Larkinella knui]|nr:TlpA disulfide reductase family protein [Larkinella knui]